jgi:hypothetical protein
MLLCAVDNISTQLKDLRTTQGYLYWRERSHRATVESTNRKVLWFAILRSLALVGVSVTQVLGIRHMFNKASSF